MKFLPLFGCFAMLASAQSAPLPDWVTIDANLAYDAHPETKLDILRPKNATGQQPAILFIHGGGWVGGAKENVVANFCLPYLEKGFVVANVEYRLAKAALAPAAVSDVLKAAEWLAKNAAKYGVDPKKIIASGDSAGGHLALMVGLTPRQANLGSPAKVAAIVNFYGITDVGDVLEGQNMKSYTVGWIPDSLADRREIARRVSPQNWVRKKLPPSLTIHGGEDPTVPYEHGVVFVKMMRSEGNDAELYSVPKGQHGDFLKNPVEGAQVWKAIFDFLSRRGLMPPS
ncbi:MAG: alpha/beta hydrolase [Bryobacteraceae bacterium]|nr:alpha/beta hydrolase [Bryobacteraceae bacterium]